MFPLTTIYTTFVFRKKSWIAFTVRSVCSFEIVIVRGHFQGRTENGRRCRKDERVSLGTKTPTQITSPGAAWILLHFGQQGLNVYLKNQILSHPGRLSLPRWEGRKLFSSYLPTWVWFMPLPISVSIPSSISTQLLNTEHDRVTTKNLAESSLFCGYLWTLALKFW